jgi:hypothetical protein
MPVQLPDVHSSNVQFTCFKYSVQFLLQCHVDPNSVKIQEKKREQKELSLKSGIRWNIVVTTKLVVKCLDYFLKGGGSNSGGHFSLFQKIKVDTCILT